MNYDKQHIDVQIGLINCFMRNLPEELLDISYETKGRDLLIQIVLIEGKNLDEKVENRLLEMLPDYRTKFIIKKIRKDQFNDNNGNWNPMEYKWLENVLFSKAQVI
ncbi:MAG: hypothetical protein KDC83_14660 [Flavobacteriales bacterium]|nr:hypothetical protein [Flavobacteriales bacterium]